MQSTKTKTALVTALLLMAGTAAVILAGSAFAADWRDYSGNVFAGNAYALTVPEGAETLEIGLVEATNTSSAKVTLFGPNDEKLGFYTFDATWPTMSIAAPEAGEYVLFVYEVKDAALKARVLSDDTESEFALRTLDLAREDKVLGTFKAGADLKQQFTVQLPAEPAFATLLYKGSVEGLTASLSSDKGAVLEIVDESATAMSPGVYTSDVTGDREVYPENIGAGAYVARVQADAFEGTLYLTTLSYTRKVVEEIPETPVEDIIEDMVLMGTGRPYAVTVPEGASGLQFLMAEHVVEHDEDDCAYYGEGYSLVTVISPEDVILGTLEISMYDEEASVFELDENATAGEYIVYAHGTRSTTILMGLLGVEGAPAGFREVASVTNEGTFGRQDSLILVGNSYGATNFTTATPMLEFAFGLKDSFASTFVDFRLYNEEGEYVAYAQNPVDMFYGPWAYGWVDFNALQAGDYVVEYSALTMNAEPVYMWLTYDRDAPVDSPAEDVAEDEEDSDEDESLGLPLPTLL